MTNTFNILVTSAGRRVSLVQSFQRALKGKSLEGKVITIDSKSDVPVRLVADSHVEVPRVSDPGYFEILEALCRREQIKLLVPTIDPELLYLSKNRKLFEALGVCVLVSSVEMNEIFCSKLKASEFFERERIRHPKTIGLEELRGGLRQFPVFLKPAMGSASIGARKIDSMEELEFYHKRTQEPIIQEYITGVEYTLDALCHFNGELSCLVPRLRLETRAGEISKGITVRNEEVMRSATRLISSLPGARGPITIQCIVDDDGEVFFTEINPRFGGGIPLTIAAGADYPKWIIEWVLGEAGTSHKGWRENMMMLRYDEALFEVVDKQNE